MPDHEPVAHLPAKDAKALLHLLRGYAAVLRAGELSQEHAAHGIDLEACGGTPWTERLAAEVDAACGLLRQSLDGFDPAAVLAPARTGAGAPAADAEGRA